MEQKPSWKAKRPSARHETLHILLNLNVHYHIHKGTYFILVKICAQPLHKVILAYHILAQVCLVKYVSII